NHIIKNSNFVNNSASMSGGTIHVDQKGSLNLENVSISSSGTHATKGSVIYSIGKLNIKNVNISILKNSYKNDDIRDCQQSVFSHSGLHWSLLLVSIEIICPSGFYIVVKNDTSVKINQHGMLSSIRQSNIEYFCKCCRQYTYSLESGKYRF
ncbi:hypothetical protein A3Q56_08151, partial [Intoshia linei]